MPLVRNSTIALVLVGSCLWGLYWLPIKLLEDVGLVGTAAGFSLSAGAFPFLLGWLIYQLFNKPDFQLSRTAMIGACCAGLGIGLWGASLAFTDVVRAILLFYLLPVWSILIECFFMQRKINLRSIAAIFASLFGIVLICRGEVPLEGLGALGDWMALSAGLIWASGAAIAFKARKPDLSLLTTFAIVGALISGGLCLWFLNPVGELSGSVAGSLPALTLTNVLTALGVGFLYMLPLLAITLWGVTQLPPALASFLLTFEVVVGVVSVALFLDQPFGWFEIGGTAFIVCGALLEILSSRK